MRTSTPAQTHDCLILEVPSIAELRIRREPPWPSFAWTVENGPGGEPNARAN
jgi:hypothetical protein